MINKIENSSSLAETFAVLNTVEILIVRKKERA